MDSMISTLSPAQVRTWANIDLDAFRTNLRLIRAQIGPEKKLCCVVKANAYGHGAPELAQVCESEGADFFAVSNIEEALQLRRSGIRLPILILGYTPAECAGLLARSGIRQAVFSEEYGRALARCAAEQNVQVTVHIKIDSGMGRIGFASRGENDADLAAAAEVCRLPELKVEGIFTHFAVADGGTDGEAYTRGQFTSFLHAVETLERQGIRFAIRHCANSAAIFDYPEMHLDMVRAGVILYGMQPSEDVLHPAPLQRVLTLESVISHVKTLRAGESVSYGRTFVAPHDMRVATVPVGYADGLWRSNCRNGLRMEIGGCLAPVIGRICMDQCMLDVSALPESATAPGTHVLVYGLGPENNTDAIARANDTINYEVTCAIAPRVPRVYKEGGKIVRVSDALLGEEALS